MRARDVMSSQVVTVAAAASLREALAAMDRTGLSKLPVLSAGRVHGLLTARGLRRALRADGAGLMETAVADLIDRELTFVDPDLPLSEVLVELQSSPALLVGESGRLLGIITARDVARVAGPWLLVMEVEATLRGFIARRLAMRSRRWWEELLPESVARSWERERFDPDEAELPPGIRHLTHGTWWQYQAIIEFNWDVFSRAFRKRDEALGHLATVHDCRNRLAHGLSLNAEQLASLQAGARYLLKRMR